MIILFHLIKQIHILLRIHLDCFNDRQKIESEASNVHRQYYIRSRCFIRNHNTLQCCTIFIITLCLFDYLKYVVQVANSHFSSLKKDKNIYPDDIYKL